MINDFKNNHPTNFFINPQQAIILGNLGYIEFSEGNKTNFTFYMSNNVKLKRVKSINADKHLNIKDNTVINYNSDEIIWQEHIIKIENNQKNNLSIDGLGLISFNSSVKLIKIKLRQGVGVSLNKYAII